MCKSYSFSKVFLVIALVCVTFVVGSTKTIAATGLNRSINYQGKLVNAYGLAVDEGFYSMKFSIYTALSGGTPIWTLKGTVNSPDSTPVMVNSGLFTIALGDGSDATNLFDFDWNQDSLYLGITVGSDDEMSPRKRLTSVPSAFTSENVQGQAPITAFSATGGGMFNIRQTSANSATGDRTALYISTSGTSNIYDYLIKASNGSEVFTVSRQGNVTTTGNFTTNGNAFFGNSSSDSIMFNGRVSSDLMPMDDSAYNLGDSSLRWKGLDVINVTSTNATTTNLSVTNLAVSGSFSLSASFSSDILPLTDTAYRLGNSSYRWYGLNAMNVTSTNVTTTNLTVSGRFTPTGNINNLLATNQDLSVVVSRDTGDAPQDISVVGPYAYVVNAGVSDSLQIFDISDINYPISVGQVAVGDDPNKVLVAGRYAFTANSGDDTISVIDVSNPATPVAINTFAVENLSPTPDIAVSGNYLFAEVSAGFTVIDISNPFTHKVVYSYALGGESQTSGLSVEGKYLYFTGRANWLSIFDITNPITPYLASTTRVGNSPTDLLVKDGHAYVLDQNTKIVDVGNAYSPSLKGSLGSLSWPEAIAGAGKYIYTRSGLEASVKVIDVSSSTNPTLVTTVTVPGTGGGIFLSGKHVFLTNTDVDSFSIIDINGIETNGLIAQSARIGNLQVSTDAYIFDNLLVGGGIKLGQGGLFGAGSLTITGTSTRSSFMGTLGIGTSTSAEALTIVGNAQNTLVRGQEYTTVGTLAVNDMPHKLVIQGNSGFLSTTSSLQRIDFSDPAYPAIESAFLLEGVQLNLTDLVVDGNLAYSTIPSQGGTIPFGISDPSTVTLYGDQGLSCAGCTPVAIAQSGSHLYIVAEPATLQISEILKTNSRITAISTTTTSASNPSGIAVQGRYIYVVNRSSENLQIFDVLDPRNPSISSTFSLGGGMAASDIKVQGKYAYVTSRGLDKLSIIDVSAPTAPVSMATISATDPTSLFVNGRYAYVTNGSANTLSIFDIASSTNPILLGSASVGNNPSDVVVAGRYAYVVNTDSDTISIVDIKGIETNALIAQSAFFGGLHIQTDGVVQNNLHIGGGLSIGFGGITSGGSLNIGSLTATSTFALAVSSTRLVVDEYAALSSNTTIGGQTVCLSNGVNCQAQASVGINDLNWDYDLGKNLISNNTSTSDIVFGGTATSTAPIFFNLSASGGADKRLVLGQMGDADLVIGNTTSSITAGRMQLDGTGLFAYGNIGSATTVWSNAGFKVSAGGVTSYMDTYLDTGLGPYTISAGTLTLKSQVGGSITLDPIPGSGGVLNLGVDLTDEIYYYGKVNTDILPYTDVLQNLGSDSYRWSGLNAYNVTSTSLTSTNLTSTNATATNILVSNLTVSNYVASTTVPELVSTVKHFPRIGTQKGSPVISGKYAYVPSNNKLAVVDIANPAYATTVGSIATTDIRHIALAGNYIYAAAGSVTTQKLYVIDVNSSTNPELVSSVSFPSARYDDIAVSGKFAYLTADTSPEFTVMDISSSTAPVVLSTFTSSTGLTSANGVAIQGKYAYVASESQLTVFDISKATTTLAGYVRSTSLAGAEYITVRGRYAYVPVTNGLTIVNIGNPANPSVVGNYTNATELNVASHVALAGDVAYVTNRGNGRLVAIDISSSTAPSFIAAAVDSATPFGITIAGRYAYVTDGVQDSDAGLKIFKISGIDVGGINAGSISADSIYTNQNIEIGGSASIRGGLSVGNGGIVSTGELAILGTASSTIFGQLNLRSGLRLDSGDISQMPKNVYSSSSHAIPSGTLYGIAVSGKYAYASNYTTNGIDVYSISNASATKITTVTETSGLRRTISTFGLAIKGNYLYIVNGSTQGSGDAKLSVMDISTPETPRLISFVTSTNQNSMREIKIQGNYAYIIQSGTTQVLIYDLTSSTRPVEVRAISDSNRLPSVSVAGLDVRGNYLYMAGSTGAATRFSIVDITDPANATATGFTALSSSASTADKGYGISVQGKYAYVSINGTSGDGGLHRVDISSSTRPVDFRCMVDVDGSTHNTGGRIQVMGDYAFVAMTSGFGMKVATIDISSPTKCTAVGMATMTGGPTTLNDFVVKGKTAYVIGSHFSTLQLYGFDTLSANIGSIFSGSLDVMDSINVLGTANFSGITSLRDITTEGVFSSQGLSTSTFNGTLLVNGLSKGGYGGTFLRSVTSSSANGALVAVASGTTITASDIPRLDSILFGTTSVSSTAAFFVNGSTNLVNHAVGVYALDNTSSTMGGAIFGARRCGGATSSNIMQLATETDSSRFRVDCSGQIFADNGTVGTPGDYAEYFPTADPTLVPGEVVVMNAETASSVRRAMSDDREYAIGVISERPLITGNAGIDGERRNNPYYKVVGLLGQLPVKASNANGAINAGDKLMAGDDGYAVKATGVGMVIGQAMESLADPSGAVMAYIDPRWSGDGVFGADNGITKMLPLGTADSLINSYDSYGLSFQGSAWDGGTAIASSFTIINNVIDASASKFSIRNTAGTDLLTISDLGNVAVTGDFTVGKRLFLGNKSTGIGSTSTYIYVDDTATPSSTYIATNADGWQSNSTYDYAERYVSNETLLPGDLVVTDPLGINLVKRSIAVSDTILGIVSTKPGFITGAHATDTYPIALAGRVPTRVSTANGAILAGDHLSPSGDPGVAVKATGSGPVVGIALESFDSPSIGMISVFVQPGWRGGEIVTSATSSAIEYQAVIATTVVSPRSGLAKIYAGETSVAVSFTSLNAYPLVTLTPYGLANGNWGVTEATDHGFTIVLGEAQTFDLVFAWKAEPSPAGATISFSDGTHATYDPTSGIVAGVAIEEKVATSSTEILSTTSTEPVLGATNPVAPEPDPIVIEAVTATEPQI